MVRDKHLVLDEQVKLYIPLWWHGQKSLLPDSSPAHCDLTPSGAYFKEEGYYFDGTNDYLIDKGGRKVLYNGTTGEWKSLLFTDGEVPPQGNIQGSGTKLCLNTSGAAPKITGSIILLSLFCPSLTVLYCYSNSISTLDVSALTSLAYLNCAINSISTLDVNALTSLIYLNCPVNSMNQVAVDTVLCDVDGYGTNNGTLNISSNAAPSAAGITCKNNLLAKGWSVTTD